MKNKNNKSVGGSTAFNYPLYNFDFNKIKSHYNKIESNKEKLLYLEYVRKEKLNNDDGIDLDLYFKGPKFLDKIENEIQYTKAKIELEKTEEAEGDKSESNLELIWWKGTEGQLIYLYEELVKKNLIDSSQDDRKYVLLSKHFKNKKGEQFTNKQMSQAAQNLVANKTRKPKNADTIDNIINNTAKQE